MSELNQTVQAGEQNDVNSIGSIIPGESLWLWGFCAVAMCSLSIIARSIL